MRAIIKPSRIGGTIRAPRSKSYAIRYILSSTLAPIELMDLAISRDVEAAIEAVKALNVEHHGNRFYKRGDLRIVRDYVYLWGSATTLRMFIPMAAVVGGRITIDGDATLRRRPIKTIVDVLLNKNIRFSSYHLPTTMEGKLRDTYVEIQGYESSQYISGFMLAFAIAGGGTIKIIPPVASRNYIYMTAHVLRQLGVEVRIHGNKIDVDVGKDVRGYSGSVPGDYLLASFYAASAMLTNGSVVIVDLPYPEGEYGDHVIVSLYREMGAVSEYKNGSWHVVASDSYKAIEVDVEDSPDLATSIAAVAPLAEGVTRIVGVKRLRIKESDRILWISEVLRRFGVQVYPSDNVIEIVGGHINEAQVVCPDDHRIAMMSSPLALRVGGEIDRAECVDKSNPTFWHDLIRLGGRITLE